MNQKQPSLFFLPVSSFKLVFLTWLLGAALCAAAAQAPGGVVADVARLSLSEGHGCAVTHGGALRCVGNNGQGQLGTGSRASFIKVARTVLDGGVTQVATGSAHTCAIASGALLCWGDNGEGQVGTGKVGGTVSKPVRVIEAGVTAVAAGGANTCAVVSGALRCWGSNREGQVGTGVASLPVASPTQVLASGVTAVATGGQHTCAVVGGALQCWGFMFDTKGSGFQTLLTPTTFIADGVTQVVAALHTCAVAKGALLCWGRNFNGQVGVPGGPAVAPSRPTTVVPSGVTDVVTDERNTCAIVRTGLHCWGSNSAWQMGHSPQSGQHHTPHPMVASGVTAVAVGMNQICAVVDGNLQCTNRVPDDAQPKQDWIALGTQRTLFAPPEPVLPRLSGYGLWRGTVGKQPVMVLLEPQNCDSSYYYLKHLWGITLTEQDKRGQVWVEGTASEAKWTFERATADTLVGQWTDAQGQRSLPIHLQRVASPKGVKPARAAGASGPAADAGLADSSDTDSATDSATCGTLNAAFNAPRVAAQKMAQTDGMFETHRYSRVSLLNGAVEGFALPDPATQPRLSQALQRWLWAAVPDYYECQTALGNRLDAKRPEPDFTRQMAPVFWNDKLLVLRETYSVYCGGAHPSGGIASYLVWDLAQDKAIEPWRWIRGGQGKYGAVTPDALNRLITRLSDRQSDAECLEAIRSTASYLAYPARKGMVFSPMLPHVVQACADDIEVPYTQLRPHLTPAGLAALEALLGVK